MTDIQIDELHILKSLCAFLDEHNLRYYLVFGTLLGAVRHKGFIPWDDDVDIAMYREDYNKLLAFPDSAFGVPFKLHEITRQDDYYELYAKFVDTSTSIELIEHQRRLGNDRHLWIDIFPIDNLPDNKLIILFIKIISIYLRKLYQWSISFPDYPRGKFKNIIIRWISTHFSYKNIYISFLKLISKYQFNNTKNVASITEMNKSFYVYPRDIFGNPQKIVFEDGIFNAPKKITDYLELQYGDYMMLPPQSERETHQFIIVGTKWIY
jgi:lipopolysaccharide cholinephosphotransferase